MTDLELTKLCAGAIENCHEFDGKIWEKRSYGVHWIYNPLSDDAQAMTLVKKFKLEGRHSDARKGFSGEWLVTPSYQVEPFAYSDDLNRAICECVAKMQLARHEAEKPIRLGEGYHYGPAEFIKSIKKPEETK